MKSIYLAGLLVPLSAVIAVLAVFLKLGILTSIGAASAIVAVVALIGAGIMYAASQDGVREYLDLSPL